MIDGIVFHNRRHRGCDRADRREWRQRRGWLYGRRGRGYRFHRQQLHGRRRARPNGNGAGPSAIGHRLDHDHGPVVHHSPGGCIVVRRHPSASCRCCRRTGRGRFLQHLLLVFLGPFPRPFAPYFKRSEVVFICIVVVIVVVLFLILAIIVNDVVRWFHVLFVGLGLLLFSPPV